METTGCTNMVALVMIGFLSGEPRQPRMTAPRHAAGALRPPRDDHAAYIGSWIKVLKNDKRAIFSAASHAQRAADYRADKRLSHRLEAGWSSWSLTA